MAAWVALSSLASFLILATVSTLQYQWISASEAEVLIGKIRADPDVISFVRAQNKHLRDQLDAEIAGLDRVWRAESLHGGGPLIGSALQHDLSRSLSSLVKTQGPVRMVIIMDDRGRNAAISARTTDYYQGDEPKWLQTYGRPTGHRHVSGLERGHSGLFVACWLSEPLNDPEDGSPIGAISVEVDVLRAGWALCR